MLTVVLFGCLVQANPLLGEEYVIARLSSLLANTHYLMAFVVFSEFFRSQLGCRRNVTLEVRVSPLPPRRLA